MFSQYANVDKRGIARLDELGAIAVIANRFLHERGRAAKFAVVNTREAWVDSVFTSRNQARTKAQNLSE